jgi:hypothetical protein
MSALISTLGDTVHIDVKEADGEIIFAKQI